MTNNSRGLGSDRTFLAHGQACTSFESHIETIFTVHLYTLRKKQVEGKRKRYHDADIHRPQQTSEQGETTRYSRSADEGPLVRSIGTVRVRAKPDHPVVSVNGNLPQVNLELAWLGRVTPVRVPEEGRAEAQQQCEVREVI